MIFSYGQSLGSGPTLHIGRYRPVSGVIVHAGLLSGLRVIRHTAKTKWFDIFPNIDNIAHVESPVFIIHGTADEEIPIHHGQTLSETAPQAFKPCKSMTSVINWNAA